MSDTPCIKLRSQPCVNPERCDKLERCTAFTVVQRAEMPPRSFEVTHDVEDAPDGAEIDIRYRRVGSSWEQIAVIDPGTPRMVTPRMMSEVFAKSVRRKSPDHPHLYDHRIAAEELNKMLRKP